MRLRQQLHEGIPAKHLQRAIAVANSGAEKSSDEDVVTPRKEAPRPGVLPVEPNTDGNRMMLGQGQQGSEVGQVKLAIRVGESDARASGSFKAGAQGGAVPEVVLVPQ